MKKYLSDSDVISEAQKIIMEFQDAFSRITISDEFISAVKAIRKCNGVVVTSGMGKMGIAIKKFSSVLCSIGIPSCYLHPGEASHGDLGIITHKDILFISSTSGKTREVLEVIDLARNINVKQIIGITSHIDSPIRDKVDIVLDMGIIQEAGHLRLAPTTSILIMLALTDCLAMVLAKDKNLTKEQYSTYHHGGYNGAASRGDNKIY